MIPLKDDNPSRTPPVFTISLIAANVLVYLYELSLPPEHLEAFIYQLGVVPAGLAGGVHVPGGLPAPLTLLSSMFLHGSLMHLLGNMLYLWIFGNNIEDETGHVRFLLFYLLCGALAAGAQVAVNPASEVPMVGASGAIAGVLGAYILLHPRARVLTLVPLLYIMRFVWLPAVVVLGLWFLLQIFSLRLGQAPGGGVAFMAHIGGFVAGMALIWIFRRRLRPVPQE